MKQQAGKCLQPFAWLESKSALLGLTTQGEHVWTFFFLLFLSVGKQLEAITATFWTGVWFELLYVLK